MLFCYNDFYVLVLALASLAGCMAAPYNVYYGRHAICTMVAIHVIRRPSHNALCVEKYVLVQHDDSMIVVKWHDNKRLYIKKARAK